MEREGESVICSECGESVPVKKVKRHNLRRHDKREYQCETCGITTVGYEKHHSHKVCKISNIFQYSCLSKTFLAPLFVKLRSRSFLCFILSLGLGQA